MSKNQIDKPEESKILDPETRPDNYQPPENAFALRNRYNEGERYFAGMSVKNQVFKNVSAAEANLSESDFESANLSGAQLMMAKFMRADLSKVNLSGADLSRADLSGANLSGADLSRADLSGANLSGADLTNSSLVNTKIEGANLTGAILNNAKAAKALWDGANLSEAKIKGTDFKMNHLKKVFFRGTNLKEVSFEGGDLSESSWEGASLEQVVFHKSKLIKADMKGLNLQGLDFTKADLTEIDFEGADLSEAKLTNAELVQANLNKAKLEHADLQGANLQLATLIKADLTTCFLKSSQLPGADLSHSNLQGVDFEDANLGRANLQGADFLGSELKGVDFSGAEFTYVFLDYVDFDEVKSLKGADFTDAVISRFELDGWTHNKLSRAQLQSLHVIDDYAKIRSIYSGFFQWFHIISMITFFAPYVYFLVYWSIQSTPKPSDENTVRIFTKLANFVYSGGAMNWEIAWFTFPIFCISLIYNAVRGILLWKTKQLELYQETTGFRPRFRLEHRWGYLFWVAKVGYWINLGLVIFHTFLFMMRYVPPQ